MKRKLIANTIRSATIRLEIEVTGNFEILSSSSIMDKNITEFQEFEMAMMLMLDQCGFELQDSHESNVPGSQSMYYTYAKVENNVDLKVVLVLRISDHPLSDTITKTGNVKKSSKQKFLDYTKSEAKKIADQYTQERGYKIRPIMITFDDHNYSSYELALNDIQDKIEEFDTKCRKDV